MSIVDLLRAPDTGNRKVEIARLVSFFGLVMLSTQASTSQTSVVVVAVGLFAAGDIIEIFTMIDHWCRRQEWLLLIYVLLYCVVAMLGHLPKYATDFAGAWVIGVGLMILYSVVRRNLLRGADASRDGLNGEDTR